ncbi:glycosyltransferase family 2 protein [Flavobacterium hercynium]|uniref:Glycosyltransferase 2-like domain-containing protein n=1 Tax=Flavobacterium hercynium TaxID=387094 RepID=A0A226HJL8_9FLAO|nr:glycosyltransferase family 2 protein [Flavobacterium hercynium]OXA94453.1 hypothetical protein B0A66_05180 [Flavobacterium hercynium]SMP29795.1 Glycosyl transferase family 2 [Flavobacterium hercynium]
MDIQKEDVFFSIIIPVYNVEDYLRQCLDSIICQTYSHFEIILVNDGSTDSSLAICVEYQKRLQNIKLITKENEGLSAARNDGLRNAEGDYIIFTDSDDFWMGETVLEELNNLIKEGHPDVVLHEETRFFSEKDAVYKNNQRFITNKSGKFEDEVLNLVYYDLFAASAWDKVIKRSILTENKLFFPLGKKSEDIEWCGELIRCLKTFSIYPKSFYSYRQARLGSITSTVNEKHIHDVYTMVKKGLNSPYKESEILNQAIQNYWGCYYVVILKDFYVLSSKMRKAVWRDIFSWRYLLKKGNNIKVDKVMVFYKFMSFRMLIFFLNGYRIKTAMSKQNRVNKRK